MRSKRVPESKSTVNRVAERDRVKRVRAQLAASGMGGRISPAERSRIRALRAAGNATRAIARQVGCSQSSVCRVIHETPAGYMSVPGVPDARVLIHTEAGAELFADEVAANRRLGELARASRPYTCWRRAEIELAARIR